MINLVYDIIRLPITITNQLCSITYSILETPFSIHKNKCICSPDEDRIVFNVNSRITSRY